MVQLKAIGSTGQIMTVSGFQFLYGTIKSLHRYAGACWFFLFQFLYGTIKSGTRVCTCSRIVNFNSSMVQLKVVLGAIVSSAGGFQFLYGTIKSIGSTGQIMTVSGFQFLYGTIKSYWIHRPNHDRIRISIPLWYN